MKLVNKLYCSKCKKLIAEHEVTTKQDYIGNEYNGRCDTCSAAEMELWLTALLNEHKN